MSGAAVPIERLYETMVRCRAVEESSADLWHEGLVSGELHTAIGEEGVSAGVVEHLRDGDALALDHRGTAPLIARGVSPYRLLAELVGAPDGLNGGYGGHMHLADRGRRALADGIVGASAPLACGFALDAKLARSGGVAVAFFGEGAANQGMLLEALNLAATWKLPVVFVCKESGLAITTRQRETTAGDLVARARAFGVAADKVRGWDVARVWRAAGDAIDRARKGRGPSFLLVRVHRPDGHFLGDPLLRILHAPVAQAAEIAPPLTRGLRAPSPTSRLDRLRLLGKLTAAFGVAAGQASTPRRDPIERTRRQLGADRAAPIEDRVRAEIDAIGARVRSTNTTAERLPRQAAPASPAAPILGPVPSSSTTGIERSFGDAIDQAVADAMMADARVIIFGEDVTLIRRNLAARFGTRRVWGTPISESAFLGAGVGAALAGLRPVVEIMLIDFIGVCFDALLNHAAKIDRFTGGRWPVPLVVRATCGGGYGDAGQHQQVLAGLLAGVPGLSVVLPSTSADAAGLMRTAIEHDGPVVFLEHKMLSEQWLDWMGGTSRSTVDFDVPDAGRFGTVTSPPAPVPLGSAARRRDGTDIALVSVGLPVHHCLAAASELAAEGIECAVVDLRTVRPLDVNTLAQVVDSCGGRVVVVDEDYLHFGLSGEIAGVLAERGVLTSFARVGLEETLPYARALEDEALPSISSVLDAARNLVAT